MSKMPAKYVEFGPYLWSNKTRRHRYPISKGQNVSCANMGINGFRRLDFQTQPTLLWSSTPPLHSPPGVRPLGLASESTTTGPRLRADSPRRGESPVLRSDSGVDTSSYTALYTKWRKISALCRRKISKV